MDDIRTLTQQCLDWLSQAPAPRILFAGMTPVLQFASFPAPHLEVCFLEQGSIEDAHVGHLSGEVPEGWVSVHNLHFGNHSPGKAERGRAWCVMLDVSMAPLPQYVSQGPVFATVAARAPVEVGDIFRRLRRLCIRQQLSPVEYDPGVVMYDPALPSSQGGGPWRLKGLLLELFSLILDSATDGESGAPPLSEPISRALSLMESRFADPTLGLTELAGVACLSVAQFGRLFALQVGRPPMAYVQHLRLREAGLLLRQTQQRMEQIADAVGYRDPLYFSKLFHRAYGQSPRSFRASRDDWSAT